MSEFGKWEPIETAPKGEPGSYASGPFILGCAVGEWGSAQHIVRWSWHKNGEKGHGKVAMDDGSQRTGCPFHRHPTE